MLLVLDAGNTHLVAGLYEGSVLRASFRVQTDRGRTADEYAVLLRSLLRDAGFELGALRGFAISNVVPALQGVLGEVARRHFGLDAFFVDCACELSVRLCIDHPQQLGADLIVAADEAYARWGGPLIVIDMGTATTLSVIDGQGRFLGVAIAPGLAVSSEAVYQRAPHLPHIRFEAPTLAWGTNTVHALQAGIVVGHACMIEGLVARMEAALNEPARVVATGGLAEALARVSARIDHLEPKLVMEGIRRIWERNQP